MFRKKPPPRPPDPLPTKFDRLTETQLYEGLEAALGEATYLLDHYRRDPTRREVYLESMEVHLETALGACRALRRKVVL
jgi:hypothetical protein